MIDIQAGRDPQNGNLGNVNFQGPVPEILVLLNRLQLAFRFDPALRAHIQPHQVSEAKEKLHGSD